MTIPYSQIPSNLRVPLIYAEVDNSKANTAPQAQRALLVGQMVGWGTATANTPSRVQSLADAKAQAGVGSILAYMAAAYFANDPTGEVWILPLGVDGGATAATGSIAFTGPATANGILSLYIAGNLYAVPVASGTTAAQVATAVAAAIQANPDRLVNAAVDGSITSKVDLTSRNNCAAMNDIDVRVNYKGLRSGEVLPAGIAVTIVAMSGGTVNPSLTTALSNLAEQSFDFIVSAFTDSTSISAISAFLSNASGRWNPMQKLYGHCFIATRGTQGTVATFGAALNDPHLSCVGFFDSPSPNFAWAAAFAGAAAASLRNDPGQPLQTLSVQGILAPPVASRYTLTQRNSLLYEGIATFTVATGGVVSIENMITTYQLNAQGEPDNSYLQVETMFLLMYVLRALTSVVTSKYARKKLTADGTRLLPRSNVITPGIVKADLIANYRQLEAAGYVQQSDAFAAGLVVEKNASNPNRLDILYPAVLIDQLQIFAVLLQFRLS